ncbi:MAG: Mov34/MPN/PAD-1 family protein [Chloroflexota bacterium]
MPGSVIHLTQRAVDEIEQAVQAVYPFEACGFLIGSGSVVVTAIAVANAAAEPETHFKIDQHAFNELLPGIRERGQSIIGFFHSHPDGQPVPSSTDKRDLAVYHPAVQLIVSATPQRIRFAAWQIMPGDVRAVTLRFDDDTEPTPLIETRAQRVAVLVGIGLAVIVFVVIALALLPPPPPLP